MKTEGVYARARSQGQEAKFGLGLCNCVSLTKSFRLNHPVKHSQVRSYNKLSSTSLAQIRCSININSPFYLQVTSENLWVWDRTIHEEMKSWRRKEISTEEGIKDEKRHGDPYLTTVPKDQFHFCPQIESENAPDFSLPLSTIIRGYKSHHSPRSNKMCEFSGEKRNCLPPTVEKKSSI